jgi:hypothetical protein
MTTINIPRLMALASKATPGPWRTSIPDDTLVIAENEEIATAFGDYSIDHESMEANAAYIAAVDPTTVLALCRRLQYAEAAINGALAAIEVYSDKIVDGGLQHLTWRAGG